MQYPGVSNVSVYSEGLRVGYRWYQEHRVSPAFAFGHGLSFTEFTYSGLAITPDPDDGGPVLVSVTVMNTGTFSAGNKFQ